MPLNFFLKVDVQKTRYGSPYITSTEVTSAGDEVDDYFNASVYAEWAGNANLIFEKCFTDSLSLAIALTERESMTICTNRLILDHCDNDLKLYTVLTQLDETYQGIKPSKLKDSFLKKNTLIALNDPTRTMSNLTQFELNEDFTNTLKISDVVRYDAIIAYTLRFSGHELAFEAFLNDRPNPSEELLLKAQKAREEFRIELIKNLKPFLQEQLKQKARDHFWAKLEEKATKIAENDVEVTMESMLNELSSTNNLELETPCLNLESNLSIN